MIVPRVCLRVRVQLHEINPKEFGLTSFSYVDRENGEVFEVNLVV